MDDEEARKIAKQALFLLDAENVGATFAAEIDIFTRLLAEAAKILVPERTVRIVGPETILIAGKGKEAEGWAGTIEVRRFHKQLRPLDTAKNMSVFVDFIQRMHARATTWREVDNSTAAVQFDLDKLLLVPKMGSDARAGMDAEAYLEVQEGADTRLLRRPVYGYVHAVPVINHPDHFIYPTVPMLPFLGVTEDELFERATANIRSLASKLKIDIGPEEKENGLLIEGMNGVVSSLLFLPEFWASISERMEDYIVVHVVSHEQIIVLPASQQAAIVGLIVSAGRGRIGMLLPATLFTYDDQGFRIFAKLFPDDA